METDWISIFIMIGIPIIVLSPIRFWYLVKRRRRKRQLNRRLAVLHARRKLLLEQKEEGSDTDTVH